MRVRMWFRGVAVCLLVGFASACGGGEEAPKAAASSDAPLPDEESLTTFANRYLAAIVSKSQRNADAMACEGASTMYAIVTGVPTGNWQIGDVSVERHNGSAEIQETVGDTALGLQAKFRDGEWCALQ